MKRIIVVGTTGSGKTTLAQQLSKKLNIHHTELDNLNFDSGWRERPRDVFKACVEQITRAEVWIIDGNYYSCLQDVTWPRADTVIWLDYSLPCILWRLICRTLKRSWTKQELWHGNRESFRKAFASRDSVLLMALKTFREKRTRYRALMQSDEYPHITFTHLSDPQQAEVFLRKLSEIHKHTNY